VGNCFCPQRQTDEEPFACGQCRGLTAYCFEDLRMRWNFKLYWLRLFNRLRPKEIAFQSISKPLLESLATEEHYKTVEHLIITIKPPARDFEPFLRPVVASQDCLVELRLDIVKGTTIGPLAKIFDTVAMTKQLKSLESENRPGAADMPEHDISRHLIDRCFELGGLQHLYFALVPSNAASSRIMRGPFLQQILMALPDLETLC
ncbi:MAG: hypothetical protein GY738_17050, partial [Pseudoalteromonas sp.]|nr:hypothetical protein [Pseudoalteromonas sp.]